MTIAIDRNDKFTPIYFPNYILKEYRLRNIENIIRVFCHHTLLHIYYYYRNIAMHFVF